MNLLFWLRKGRLNKRGQAPIMCRITYLGKRAPDFSTGAFCAPKDWNQIRQASNDRFVNAKLLDLKRSADALLLQAQLTGAEMDAKKLSHALMGKVPDEENILKLFERYIEHQADKKPRTIKRYYQVRNELARFLSTHGINTISGQRFTMSQARAIHDYFTEQGSSPHNASRKVLLIRAVLQFAVQYGYIENNMTVSKLAQVA